MSDAVSSGPAERAPRRIDGRLVIAGIVLLGVVFVVLNLLVGGGSTDVREFDHPRSGPATAGESVPVRLLSPCAPFVDFDGMFWGPPGGWHLDLPAEPATISLEEPGRALLVTASRQRFELRPLDAPVRLSLCGGSSQSF
ncbi:MAG: hypothetical protein ABR600_01000 [Actinomycetota bacterium]